MLGLKLLLRQLPQWYLCPIRVIYRFHSVEKHESGNSFFLGGGMSEEVETLGKIPPPLNDLLPRTVKSFMQFSYSVTPPLPEFLDPPLYHIS